MPNDSSSEYASTVVIAIDGGTLNPVATVDSVQNVTAGGTAGADEFACADGGSRTDATQTSAFSHNVIYLRPRRVTSKR